MSEVQLPERPEPEDCESLPFDAYSGMQMLAYGRACAEAQRLADSHIRAAANALLHQIDIGDFVDSNGHSAKMLKATHDLMALLTPNA